MNKTILVAPGDGPLAAAFAREARSAGWSVILAGPEAAVSSEEDSAEGGLLSLPWNPSSYVSTSALFLAARNAAGEPAAVVLISGASELRADLVGGKAGEVETALLKETLGPALLVREALRSFEARKAGTLVLLGVESEAAAQGPAAALAAGAFRGLGDGIFAASREAAWEAFGILDKGGNPGETARFTLRLLDESKGGKSGRWLRFTGKPGIFGVF